MFDVLPIHRQAGKIQPTLTDSVNIAPDSHKYQLPTGRLWWNNPKGISGYVGCKKRLGRDLACHNKILICILQCSLCYGQFGIDLSQFGDV